MSRRKLLEPKLATKRRPPDTSSRLCLRGSRPPVLGAAAPKIKTPAKALSDENQCCCQSPGRAFGMGF